MVQAVPSNSFPTVTWPNYGKIYIKIPQNSEDHTKEPRVFQQKIIATALHNTLLRNNIQKISSCPRITHLWTMNSARQLFLSCMHLPFFCHSTSHKANSCTISEKPKGCLYEHNTPYLLLSPSSSSSLLFL
jgi:hypothetical protein